MTKEQFEKLLGAFYLEGTPDLAVTALSFWLSSSDLEQQDDAQVELHKRLFRLIRRRFPEVRARWLDLSESSTPLGRQFVTEICTESLPEARPPIQTAEDLDVRWAEFLVSGETQPIEEIVEVLSWPDRLRARIEAFLSERRRFDFLFGSERRRRMLGKLAALGIGSDESLQKLESPFDLDCLALMNGMAVDAERCKILQAALPKPLEASDLLCLATKATAKWSLWSNAGQHPRVLAVCVDALGRVSGAPRLGLLQIIAEAAFRQEPQRTVSAAQEFLALVPGHSQIVGLLREAQRQSRILDRQSLFAASASSRTECSVNQGTSALRRCLLATKSVSSYRLHLTVRNPSEPGFPARDGLQSEWDLDVVSPDRFFGERWFWNSEEKTALADRWITIGTAHYENPSFWVRFAKPFRTASNLGLCLDAYLSPLQTATTAHTWEVSQQQQSFVLLEFVEVLLPELSAAVGSPSDVAPSRVWLWIESETGLLAAARVELRFAEQSTLLLEQVFFDYGEPIQIEAPELIVDTPVEFPES